MRVDCISKCEDKYKQVFVISNILAPYTSAKIAEDDYLQTEIWKEKRMARFRLDGFKCQRCGSGKNLVCHHIRYPAAWGLENIEDDLITLCDDCHSIVHCEDIKNGGGNE